MFNGQCSIVNGQWSMFNDQWSKMRFSESRAELVRAMPSESILGAANGQCSMVNGQCSMAKLLDQADNSIHIIIADHGTRRQTKTAIEKSFRHTVDIGWSLRENGL